MFDFNQIINFVAFEYESKIMLATKLVILVSEGNHLFSKKKLREKGLEHK